jgi:hypothetical protein
MRPFTHCAINQFVYFRRTVPSVAQEINIFYTIHLPSVSSVLFGNDNSVVSIATRYGTYVLEFEHRWGRDFS